MATQAFESSQADPIRSRHSVLSLEWFWPAWHRVALGAVLVLAAFLNLFRLNQNGYANTYYSAAVRSMLESWHNFLFASFDPGGLVSVDKPPLALWVEAASAKAFGYSGFAILLPEAIAGVAAVGLLYLVVARPFGRVAGLVAALALAVSPVSVAVNRDNNPDALFALLLIASVYVGMRAVESGRLATLLLAAGLVGLAFNTKMLAAMLVVPGLLAAYASFARIPWRRRAWQLAIAGAVLVVVSGAWIAAVELTPAGDRPYVGSTDDNSALSLALGYNGLGRVTGQTGGTSIGGGGGGLGGAFSGTPGVLRLANDVLGDQGGWLLVLAIVGGLSALLAAIRHRSRTRLAALVAIGGWFAASAVIFSLSSGIIHTYYLSAMAPATSALVGIGLVALVDDARSRRRMVLPLVALLGSALLALDLLRRSGYLPWLQVLVVVGAVVGVVGILAAAGWPGNARRSRWATVAIAVSAATLFAAPLAWSATTSRSAINGVFPGAGPNFVSGLGVTSTSGLGFPGGGAGGFGRRGNGGPPTGNGRPSFAPPTNGGQGFAPPAGGIPGQGAPTQGGFGGGRTGGGFGGTGSSADVDAALAYATANGPGSRWTLIVGNEQQAAQYVIAGKRVASMGGFTGRETVLTPSYLSKLVSSGEARYFLLGSSGFGGGFGPGSNNAAATTVESVCTAVDTDAWSSTSSTTTGSTVASSSSLYDCSGKAAELARA